MSKCVLGCIPFGVFFLLKLEAEKAATKALLECRGIYKAKEKKGGSCPVQKTEPFGVFK